MVLIPGTPPAPAPDAAPTPTPPPPPSTPGGLDRPPTTSARMVLIPGPPLAPGPEAVHILTVPGDAVHPVGNDPVVSGPAGDGVGLELQARRPWPEAGDRADPGPGPPRSGA